MRWWWGSDKWAHTGWTCYDCGGSGKGKMHDTRLYTPEELAVLNERRDKMRDRQTAKRQSKAAEVLAERWHREGERAAMLDAQPFFQEFKALMATFTEQRPAPSFLADMWARIKGDDLTPNQEGAVRKFIASAKDREFKKEHSTHLGVKGERLEIRGKVIACKPIYPTMNSFRQEIRYMVKFETPDRQTLTWFTSRSYTVGVELIGKATVVDHTEWNGVKETKIKRFLAKGEVDGKQAELF